MKAKENKVFYELNEAEQNNINGGSLTFMTTATVAVVLASVYVASKVNEQLKQ